MELITNEQEAQEDRFTDLSNDGDSHFDKEGFEKEEFECVICKDNHYIDERRMLDHDIEVCEDCYERIKE